MSYRTGVDVTMTALYQADCARCGWHTRQTETKRWADDMAARHEACCPNPPLPRNGCTMSCGCWWYGIPGSSVGYTHADCPLHGRNVVTACNVDEPANGGDGHWTPGEGTA